MHAKHDAAKQMIEMIKKTAECGGDLGEVPNQTLQKCSKRHIFSQFYYSYSVHIILFIGYKHLKW